jgi:hypothetical protein
VTLARLQGPGEPSTLRETPAVPTLYNATNPDSRGVFVADFAWSTIDGKVGSAGVESPRARVRGHPPLASRATGVRGQRPPRGTRDASMNPDAQPKGRGGEARSADDRVRLGITGEREREVSVAQNPDLKVRAQHAVVHRNRWNRILEQQVVRERDTMIKSWFVPAPRVIGMFASKNTVNPCIVPTAPSAVG